jgi:hypothetical protein
LRLPTDDSAARRTRAGGHGVAAPTACHGAATSPKWLRLLWPQVPDLTSPTGPSRTNNRLNQTTESRRITPLNQLIGSALVLAPRAHGILSRIIGISHFPLQFVTTELS